MSGEVPQRLLSTNGEDSPEPYYVSYDGNFYDKHFNLYPEYNKIVEQRREGGEGVGINLYAIF